MDGISVRSGHLAEQLTEDICHHAQLAASILGGESLLSLFLAWSGLVWSGLAWSGLVWSDLVWSGLVWAGRGWAGLAKCNSISMQSDTASRRSKREAECERASARE